MEGQEEASRSRVNRPTSVFSVPPLRHEPAAAVNAAPTCGRRLSATPGPSCACPGGLGEFHLERPRPTFYPGPEEP